MQLLEINDLKVSAGGNQILGGVSLSVGKGETHVLMGPNGSGKSTLVNTIMGHPGYEVEGGQILFEGEDITHAAANERAKAGIFLSFQSPEEVPGVTLENFMRVSRAAVTEQPVKLFAYKKELASRMQELEMDAEYASRYLNVGFSGGEKKKSEILQMLMLSPKLAILDETDSGLDVDAVKIVSKGVQAYKNSENALLVITHNTKILENLHVDHVHVLIDGKVVCSGGNELIEQINRTGFQQFMQLQPQGGDEQAK